MRLSIIIPVFNVESYVGMTLESVFVTTASPDEFEVIIVNDGTKDGSMAVVRRFADRPNLKVLEQENQGLSAARMKGWTEARGEYVWFVDGDDYLVENAVEKVLRWLDVKSDVDVLMFPLIRVSADGKSQKQDYQLEGDRLMDGKEIIRDPKLPVWNSTRFVLKRKLMENPWVFFPERLLHEDEYFNVVLLSLTKTVWVMKDSVYFHLNCPGSIMNSLTYSSFEDMLAIYRLEIRFMKHVLDPSDWKWFQAYTFKPLVSSFNRFPHEGICWEGPYVWRAWLNAYSEYTWKTSVKRLLFFMMPERFARYRA